MEIELLRTIFHDTATCGAITIGHVFECYSLEDKDRGLSSEMELTEIKSIKVYGQTAIPTGRYKINKIWWPQHERWVPHILNVPGYEGILIHSGVTSNDTLGCPLLAEKVINDVTQNTTAARVKFDTKVFAALDRGEEVWITILRSEPEWNKLNANV